MNDFYIFGGTSSYSGDTRQISRLNGCQLDRIGSLAFDHMYGACTVFDQSFIYLCFNNNSTDYKKCRVGFDPLGSFTEITSTTHDHRTINIAASDCELIDVKFG